MVTHTVGNNRPLWRSAINRAEPSGEVLRILGSIRENVAKEGAFSAINVPSGGTVCALAALSHGRGGKNDDISEKNALAAPEASSCQTLF